jgi:hypothetical protein
MPSASPRSAPHGKRGNRGSGCADFVTELNELQAGWRNDDVMRQVGSVIGDGVDAFHVAPTVAPSAEHLLFAAPAAQPSLRRLTKAETDQLGYTPIFDDSTLELVRLLRDGAEIEHSLLVQYLYAAFSVKLPEYAHLAGWPNHRYGGRPLHLIGVAIEEMTHLDVVNELHSSLSARHRIWVASSFLTRETSTPSTSPSSR